MEEENQVFGKIAEAVDNNTNLESEDLYFYNQNKEEAKKNIDSSSKELTDFIDSLIQDVPVPSDEEISAGIEKILKTTHPEENQLKTGKKKKVTYKVLFIAALLSILSVSCLFVVGSNHDISIENGFVTFAKDTIKTVFFGEGQEKYISVDALLTDLKAHGYDEILFPEEFLVNSDKYKVEVPVFHNDSDIVEQVSFKVHNEVSTLTFNIHKCDQLQTPFSFIDIDDIETIVVNDIYIYVLKFNGENIAEFICDEYRYSIQSNIVDSKFLNIINSIERSYHL